MATGPNEFADVPDATTILAAGKITGRTASGFTVGLLNAVTGQANARRGAATRHEVMSVVRMVIGPSGDTK